MYGITNPHQLWNKSLFYFSCVIIMMHILKMKDHVCRRMENIVSNGISQKCFVILKDIYSPYQNLGMQYTVFCAL